MAVYKETIEVKSHGKTPTYIDITKDVRRAVSYTHLTLPTILRV